MAKSFQKILLLAVLLTSAALVTACGGGGGGGGPTPVAVYDGIETAATLTPSNAETLALEAYAGVGGTSLDGYTPINYMAATTVTQQDLAAAANSSNLQRVAQTLKDAVLDMKLTEQSGTPTVTRTASSIEVQGYCGGTMSYSFSLNDQTGIGSGSFKFNSFTDDCSTILSGSASFSFAVTADLQAISITFKTYDLTTDTDTESTTISGSITMTIDMNTSAMTTVMNIAALDYLSGLTYKVEDYRVIVDTYGDIEISGKYYNPLHGYVTISTLDKLYIGYNGWPDYGRMHIEGAYPGNYVDVTFTSTGATFALSDGSFWPYTLAPL